MLICTYIDSMHHLATSTARLVDEVLAIDLVGLDAGVVRL